MRQLVWLDLCSGLGGASQLALDRGWKVIRVDIDPRFKPERRCDCGHIEREHEDSGDNETCDKCSCCEPRWLYNGTFIVADVRNRDALAGLPSRPDVLWASSVCKDFSKWGMRCFNPNPPQPDLTLALACKTAEEILQPDYWFHENVWASRPWLNRIFGKPIARIPGHVIWGNLGVLFPQLAPHKGSAHAKHTSGKRWGAIAHTRHEIRDHREAAEVAAKIPYEIGEAICAAVERRVEDSEAVQAEDGA